MCISEAYEVAKSLPTEGIRAFADAARIVRHHMGLPSEVGFQVFDSVAAALLARAAFQGEDEQ